MRYDIDDLFNSAIPEAIGLPDLGNSALENIDPNTLGTGEVGTQLGNVGQAQALIVVKPNEDIQKAIDKLRILGGGKVFLLNGTHIVNYDIQLYSSITLEGENSETAIIDFGSTSKQIKSIGTSVYTTGTVSVSNNGTTVTGSGTSWATNAVAGQYILLAGVWYPIAVVTNDTSITIAVPFADVALSGATYTICSPVQDMKIENLVVKNSAVSAVKIQYANEFVLSNLNFQTSLVGLELDTTSQTVVENIDCTANYTNYKFTNAHFIIMTGSSGIDSLSGHGMELNGMTNSAVSSTFILNSASDGVNLVSCKNCRIDGVFVENAGSGMEFVSGNENIVVFNNRIEKNAADGVKLTATSDNIFIQSSFIKENTGYGVNIAASTCDNTVITGNNFSGNTTAAVSDSGTGTMIRGNVGVSDNTTSTSGNVSAQFYAKENLTQNDAVYVVDGVHTYTNTYSSSANTAGVFFAFYSNSSTAFGSITDVSSTSQNFTVSGTDPLLVVDVRGASGGSNDITSVTFNGSALTKVAEAAAGRWISTWVLNNPPVGTYTLAFNTAPDTAKASVYTNTGTTANKVITSQAETDGGTTLEISVTVSGNNRAWLHLFSSHNAAATLNSNSGTVRYNDGVITVIDSNGQVTGAGVKKASASASGTANGFIGFVNTTVTQDNLASVVLIGAIDTFSGLTLGSQYYLSNTAGAISTSAGTVTRKVGIAINPTTLLITNIW